MFKKVLLVGAGFGLLAVLLFGKDAASYVCTSYDQVTNSVQSSFPVEFQIDRARKMVSELKPVIRDCKHVIAKEEVRVRKLDDRIASAETKSDQDKTNVLRLQADLSDNKSVYHYAGRSYSVTEVKEDLSRRFERFKTAESTLGSLKKMRDARQNNLDAAVKKLDAMITAQRQLQVEITNLEAKHKLVEVAAASSDFQFDDSKLSRAKELIDRIHTDLEVTAKLANADVDYRGEIPLDKPVAENIEQDIASYFGLNGPDSVNVAVSIHMED